MSVLLKWLLRTAFLFFGVLTSVYGATEVQLPFIDGNAYVCMQNSDDSPSHGRTSSNAVSPQAPYTVYDLDFGMNVGTILVAPASGTLHHGSDADEKGYGGGFGWFASVDTGDGKWAMIAHLSSYIVPDGQQVTEGQPIAYSGGSPGAKGAGTSTGPHVHFGVRSGGGSGTSQPMKVWAYDRNTSDLKFFLTGKQGSGQRDFVCYNEQPGLGNQSGHKYESRPIGQIFSDFSCRKLSGSDGVLCWQNSPVDCVDGSKHTRYYKNNQGAMQSESKVDTWKWCLGDALGQNANVFSFLEGGYGVGGSSNDDGGSTTTPPIAGTDNSGNLPNLVMRDVYLLDADKHRIPSIRIREKGYCHMNVANIGTRMAKEKFENRCWLSDGLWFDGKDNAIDLGKEDMENLDDGKSRSSNEDFFAPEWPGTYNLVGCTDASKKEKESNEKDNCNMGDHGLKKEYVFQVTSSPDLATIAVGTINGRSVFDVNEPFGIFSTTFNQGENYGEKYASVGYFVDGNLVGQSQIRRDNMKGGYSKIEELTLLGGIATAGSHEIKICIDFIEAIAETDETNNCLSFAVTVRGSDAPVPCQVITPGNWNEWQGLGYAPPFTESGKQVLNAFCERGNPNSLKVTVGYAGSTQLISYLRGYVEGGSGVFLPQTLTCAGRVNGDWCDGVATFEVSGPEINTMTAIKPTKFYGATCEVVNNAWECSGWRLGAAVQTGSQ